MNLTIDVISDVICPWCYIGKRRLERAIAAFEGHRFEFVGSRSNSIRRCRRKESAARNIASESLAVGSGRWNLTPSWLRSAKPKASISPSTGLSGRRTPWMLIGLSGLLVG